MGICVVNMGPPNCNSKRKNRRGTERAFEARTDETHKEKIDNIMVGGRASHLRDPAILTKSARSQRYWLRTVEAEERKKKKDQRKNLVSETMVCRVFENHRRERQAYKWKRTVKHDDVHAYMYHNSNTSNTTGGHQSKMRIYTLAKTNIDSRNRSFEACDKNGINKKIIVKKLGHK